jgi:transcriptional repressor NrdR
MKCPFCNSKETQVIDTRLNDDGAVVKRRRRCLLCERRFNTFESIELILPLVVKSNGGREEFSAFKIRSSLLKALHKRPVSIEQVDEVIEKIRQEVLFSNHKEIETKFIGDLIMDNLGKLDKVAYIRFASVYRSFQDITDFNEIIQQVEK